MLSKRFRELVDYLISKKRTDISISFVTNGTILDQTFIDQLKTFRSFDIEISLESVLKNNDYIRQGSNTDQTIKNIDDLKLTDTNGRIYIGTTHYFYVSGDDIYWYNGATGTKLN